MKVMADHPWYTTFAKQKDGRINLGTAAHYYASCPHIKGRRKLVKVEGELLKLIPKCKLCIKRLQKAEKSSAEDYRSKCKVYW